jgi:RimJ/RimL family protein N-acetyltransferase
MLIRKTEEKDLPEISEIYSLAKQYMRAAGNKNQWSGDYPNGDSARDDMEKGIGCVCEEDGEVVAVFAFDIGEEKTYNRIYGGAWLDSAPYAYIHRIAVKKHGMGIVDFCFSECFKMHPNLKIDTHRDNIPMQKVLLRNGFSYCGIIYLSDGSERLAYQKNK